MSRPYLPVALRRLVIERARGCCEYCLLHEDDAAYSHWIDHILALRHGGQTVSENLALTCPDCNRRKGTDFAGIEPGTGAIVRLFNPRADQWPDHFQLQGTRIIGTTPTGQRTIVLLGLNDEIRLLERELLMLDGRYPPPVLPLN